MMNLAGCRCLIVGGGPIAERKLRSLLQAGAEVTVVSPTFTAGILGLENRSDVMLKKQIYDPMIWGCHGEARYALVIAATNDSHVNQQIAQKANAQGLLVNIVDKPELSSFILPSVVRRGKLVITVSTGGASPSAARKIAKEIDKTYGDEYEIYLDFLSETRLLIQNQVQDKAARQRLFKEMLAWDLMRLIREGKFKDWKVKFDIALQGAAWMQTQEQGESELSSWSFINDLAARIGGGDE
ncbi:bifunctional precorrin-2 dehydrogenase/sirohydrochlorin ferrochelatase [Paenibacillus sp. Soil766]|uniref:precorrin-2 dehydrogenase/sirohydrochlorin ferrochelatase family protein n=1 Tax=Paenibacillus sp. Soil766 TaxID=1736404 RepID=UPI001F380353|nr:bifunctional precorrin-2 dehydrogenase/sirohydrochlorin ferrochelatase [Paenibacillus sp. Soil766]